MYRLLEFNCQKRLVYPLTTRGETSPDIRNRKLLEEVFNGVPLWRRPKEPSNALKRPILGYSKKVQACEAVDGAGVTFCLEPQPPEHFMPNGSHSRSWDIVPRAGVRATQNFADLASIPWMWIRSPSPSNMTEVVSKSPGYLIHTRSPSRTEYFPGLQSRNPGRITRNS